MTRDDEPQADPASGDESSPDDEPMSLWTQAGLVGGLGFEIVGFSIAGVWLGSIVDEAYATAPWGALIGLMLGLAGVGVHIWHVVNRLLGDDG